MRKFFLKIVHIVQHSERNHTIHLANTHWNLVRRRLHEFCFKLSGAEGLPSSVKHHVGDVHTHHIITTRSKRERGMAGAASHIENTGSARNYAKQKIQ